MRPSSGATPLNAAAIGDDPSVSPKPVVTRRHRDRREEGEHDERGARHECGGDGGQDQDAHPRAAARAVHEPDPKRTERRADGMPVVLVRVWMGVHVEVAVLPADEEPDREEHDQRCHGGLGALLHALRQELLEEEDGQAEQHEGERVTEAPEHAQPCGGPAHPLLARGNQGRHGRDVIRVGRMTEAEQGRDEDHDEDGATAREVDDGVVEAEHRGLFAACAAERFGPAQTTPGSALTVITTPTQRITSALTAGRARTSGPSNETRLKARRASTATSPIPVTVQASPRLNARISAEAEADPVQGDRTEKDDQRGRTGQDRRQRCRPQNALGRHVLQGARPWSWSCVMGMDVSMAVIVVMIVIVVAGLVQMVRGRPARGCGGRARRRCAGAAAAPRHPRRPRAGPTRASARGTASRAR